MMSNFKRGAGLVAPRDSLAWRVLDFLQANPGEELTRGDIAVKFNIEASAVDSLLAPAVSAGHLVREVGGADGVIWKPNAARGRFPKPFVGSVDASRRAVRAHRQSLIDISSFTIEKDIPLVDVMRRVNQWNALFARMELGDSFLLPQSARMAAAHAQAKYRKSAREVMFAMRKVSDTHSRIWRTA
jgi:hypothetical protein